MFWDYWVATPNPYRPSLKDAAKRLGFSPKQLAPGTNGPPDSDMRSVGVRDYPGGVFTLKLASPAAITHFGVRFSYAQLPGSDVGTTARQQRYGSGTRRG